MTELGRGSLKKIKKKALPPEAVLRVAADGFSDVEAQQRSPGADGLAGDAEALEGLAGVAGDAIGEEAVVVERLEAELLGEDEAVRQMGDDRLLGAPRSGPNAGDAVRAEEAELVFRETVKMLTIEVVHVDADALELREVKALRQRRAERRVVLLRWIVFAEDAPRLPRRAVVVVVEAGDGVAPARILRVDAG